MWIERYYESQPDFLLSSKVNILYGPRRVGKTALIKKILETRLNRKKIFMGEGDDIDLRQILSSEQKARILQAFDNYDIIFIDEAQRIPNIGWALKIMIDNFENKTIIASGSSSFRLSSEIGEPLTGRSHTSHLYPIAILELYRQFGGMYIYQNLEQFLIFGMYPEVLTSDNEQAKKLYLRELRNSYLLKDILEIEKIKSADILFQLLRLLAYQIGHEVSLSELGKNLNISKHTVKRYLELLEKSFILFKLNGFSKNLRKEITKTSRYYFYDIGLRNALINNFNSLDNRNDQGMLWENFLIMERIKKQAYQSLFSNNYFWRTYDQKEIDWVEEREGKLYGYEFKWGNKKPKAPKQWLETYPEAQFKVINKENFLDFVL